MKGYRNYDTHTQWSFTELKSERVTFAEKRVKGEITVKQNKPDVGRQISCSFLDAEP